MLICLWLQKILTDVNQMILDFINTEMWLSLEHGEEIESLIFGPISDWTKRWQEQSFFMCKINKVRSYNTADDPELRTA